MMYGDGRRDSRRLLAIDWSGGVRTLATGIGTTVLPSEDGDLLVTGPVTARGRSLRVLDGASGEVAREVGTPLKLRAVTLVGAGRRGGPVLGKPATPGAVADPAGRVGGHPAVHVPRPAQPRPRRPRRPREASAGGPIGRPAGPAATRSWPGRRPTARRPRSTSRVPSGACGWSTPPSRPWSSSTRCRATVTGAGPRSPASTRSHLGRARADHACPRTSSSAAILPYGERPALGW